VHNTNAPSGGGVIKIPLSSISEAQQPFKTIIVKASITGKNGATTECEASLHTSKLDAKFDFTVPQEANVFVSNGTCASDGRAGVARFDATLQNLFEEDVFTSFTTTPITEDLRFVQCQPAEAKVAQNEKNLFSQKIRCLYLAKGTTAHIEYVNNQTVLAVRGSNVPDYSKSLISRLTICSYPGSDGSFPCQEKSGRSVVKGLSAPLSASTKGMVMCPSVLPSGEDAKNIVAPFAL
jgi:hypothetical protein